MEIIYSSIKVEKIITIDKKLIKTIGSDLAKIVIQRLNEIKASTNFYKYKEMSYDKPHPLRNISNDYAVHLNANYRLIIKPLFNDLSDCGLKMCTKVEVKGVVDYHGSKQIWKIP